MSKSKTPVAQPGKKVSKTIERLQKAGKGAADRLLMMAGTPKFWLLLACGIIGCIIFPHDVAPGVSLGLLYLMPDGEAKSGRTGSVVYMRNGRRRNFVVPSLVQNGYTTPVRASFSNFSSLFKTLTPEQQSQWNSATGFFKSDRFGRSKEIRGKSLFVMLNQNLYSAGLPGISDVPLADAVLGLDSVIITDSIDPADSIISWSTGATGSTTKHLIFATAPLSPGISKPGNSQFRQIGVIPAAQASPMLFGAMIQAKFGVPTAGQKQFIKLVPVSTESGKSGGAIVASAIVVP